MATTLSRSAVRRQLARWTVALLGAATAPAVEAVPIVTVGSATVGVAEIQFLALASGAITITAIANPEFFWCVRGGHGTDAQ